MSRRRQMEVDDDDDDEKDHDGEMQRRVQVAEGGRHDHLYRV